MRNEELLNKVRESSKAYYIEALKNSNSFGIVVKEPRKLKRVLKKAEDEAFYDGFDEDEIRLAKQYGMMKAMEERSGKK